MYIGSVALNSVECVSINMELCSGVETVDSDFGAVMEGLPLRNGTESLV